MFLWFEEGHMNLKTILITGSTDGIGYETAKILTEKGHRVLLHGRNPEKLKRVSDELSVLGTVEFHLADLSDLNQVNAFGEEVRKAHKSLDVLINNAGVLKVSHARTVDDLDVRFAVNTYAPYLLTKSFLPLLKNHGRVIHVSSAAQAPVDMDALSGKKEISDAMIAYSQSKLALMMWAKAMTDRHDGQGPLMVSINPGSLLGSKMVKEGFGIEGKDLRIGADILIRAALSDDFSNATGRYFDNDAGAFLDPHADALDAEKCQHVLKAIETCVGRIVKI